MNDMNAFNAPPVVGASFDTVRAAMAKAIANLTSQEIGHRKDGHSQKADQLWEWIKQLLLLSVAIEEAHARYLASSSSQPQIQALTALTAQVRDATQQFQAIADILKGIAAVIELFGKIAQLKL